MKQLAISTYYLILNYVIATCVVQEEKLRHYFDKRRNKKKLQGSECHVHISVY